jgi:putative ABC transport system ATP-binding protein
MQTVIQLHGAARRYAGGQVHFDALKPTNLEVAQGEYVGLVGASGSGKSTLLNLIAGIDHPTAGRVEVMGEHIGRLGESRLAAFRGRHIGIVFQFFQLVPTLTVVENVVLAMDLVGSIPRAGRWPRALDLLAEVGVECHARKLPASLSGGEQQRVAIARALANDPAILIADEPTGNLDTRNREVVGGIFESCVDQGRTVVVATHDTTTLGRYARLFRLEDGRVSEARPRPTNS